MIPCITFKLIYIVRKHNSGFLGVENARIRGRITNGTRKYLGMTDLFIISIVVIDGFAGTYMSKFIKIFKRFYLFTLVR